MANTIFKSTTTLLEGVKVDVKSGIHSIVIDEPVESGGTDSGMNPLELLLGALGSCKSICARMLASAHNIDLQEFSIDVEGVLDPDGFMGLNKDAKIGFSEITTKINIKSNSSEEEINKLVGLIDSICPVQDSLSNSPVLKTEVSIER